MFEPRLDRHFKILVLRGTLPSGSGKRMRTSENLSIPAVNQGRHLDSQVIYLVETASNEISPIVKVSASLIFSHILSSQNSSM